MTIIGASSVINCSKTICDTAREFIVCGIHASIENVGRHSLALVGVCERTVQRKLTLINAVKTPRCTILCVLHTDNTIGLNGDHIGIHL